METIKKAEWREELLITIMVGMAALVVEVLINRQRERMVAEGGQRRQWHHNLMTAASLIDIVEIPC